MIFKLLLSFHHHYLLRTEEEQEVNAIESLHTAFLLFNRISSSFNLILIPKWRLLVTH